MRKKHITRLQSVDLLLGRNIRVLNLEFIPTVHGKFARLHGSYVLTGGQFEVIIQHPKLVSNLENEKKLINAAIMIGDFWNITRLD